MLALIVVGAACGSGRGREEPAPAAPQVTTTPAPSRTAGAVVETAEKVETARARGADPSALSSAVVHVRGDGAIEVLVHTATPVTAAQLDELRRLGTEVVTTTATPAVAGQAPGSLVQAWVPSRSVAAVDALPWIAAVTAPSYGVAGG